MHRKLISLLLAVTLGATLVAGAAAKPNKRVQRLMPVAVNAAAAYLGVKPAALRKSVKAGQSLAQLATAQSKSIDGLQTAMLAAVETKLDAAVAAGKLEADREAKLLTRVQARIAALVNRAGKALPQRASRVKQTVLLRAAAGYLGLAPKALRAQLRAGKTLAQVAAAQQKDVAGLQAAMLAAAKTKLDKAVAAGKLTAAQEQAALTRLATRIAKLVSA